MSRIEELKKKIADAAKSYWDLGVSEIPDAEYDKLVEELKGLTGLEDRIGDPRVVSSGKVEHKIPMLSMQKVYNIGKVADWVVKYAGNSDIIVMPKYDGIALVRYNDGTIATRGDGKTGENVTEVAHSLFFERKHFMGYGECVCPLSEFPMMREYGYKNPRNAVSGIMSSLDPSIHERVKHLEFVPYDHIVVFVSRQESSKDQLQKKLEDAAELVGQMARNYPLDGIVFRIADENLFQRLGHTDHHWRGQIALKSANISTESIIERIDWQGKNGTITPVANIAPVVLGGAEITRVTLHNAKRVRDWDIRVGDHCSIERAGGVIPKIVKTWHDEHNSDEYGLDWLNKTCIPTECPTCGHALTEDGARLYCPRCNK